MIELTVTPTEYVEIHQWTTRFRSGHIEVEVCPYCGDAKYHFRVNRDNGLWDCKKCNASGNLITLMRKIGDLSRYLPNTTAEPKRAMPLPAGRVESVHDALMRSEEGMAFLRKRGFTHETIRRFMLGYQVHSRIGPCVGYPVFADGKCWVIKWRSISGKEFCREPEKSISPLFNQDALKTNKDIILAEGESDAISLIQAGFENVVGTILGAGSSAAEWVREVKRRCRKVYIAYDPDDAGNDGAERVALAIGRHKCYRVSFPKGYDANDYVNCYGAEGVSGLIAGASPMGQPSVLDAERVYEQYLIHKSNGNRGIVSGIKWWDDLVGPLRPANLYVLAGYAGIGKSTLAAQVAWEVAKKGRIVWYYCLEMSVLEVFRVITENVLGKRDPTDEEYAMSYSMIQGTGFRFFDPSLADARASEQFDFIAESVKEHGVELLVVDNFHYLSRSDKNTTEYEGLMSKRAKQISVECNIPVLMLHHPRKPEGEEREPDNHSMRGSSAIVNDASSVIVLHRRPARGTEPGDEDRERVGILKVTKSRWGKSGRGNIYYETDKARFRQATAEDYAGDPDERPRRRYAEHWNN